MEGTLSRGRGPVGHRPGREQIGRFIEAAAALGSGSGEGEGPPPGPRSAGPSLALGAQAGLGWTGRCLSGLAVGQSARSQQPLSSTSLVTTSSTSHRPWARAAARKALGGEMGKLRPSQPLHFLWAGGVPPPSPNLSHFSPGSPDTVLIPQGLGCPQLGVQVVVDTVHLAQSHPVPTAQRQGQEPQ